MGASVDTGVPLRADGGSTQGSDMIRSASSLAVMQCRLEVRGITFPKFYFLNVKNP